MTSKYFREKIPMKILKSCFKFVFLTKMFKERNQRDIPKTFSKMQWLETSKYTIFLTLSKIQNLWNLINILIKKIWKYVFKCFLWCFKIRWVQENQGVTFLVVSPNNVFAHLHNQLTHVKKVSKISSFF
jgi:hypothetical protein